MNQAPLDLISRCRSLKSLKSVHARLLVDGSISSSELVLNKIIRSYSRFGALDYACKIFDAIPRPNAFLWTAMIHGHVDNHRYEEALILFRRMRRESVPPLNFTLSSVLKALARQTRLKEGEAVQGLILKYGLDSDLTLQNSVLDLFSRCGRVDIARQVFEGMEDRDVVSWNSMIYGYVNNSELDIACELFDRMPERNVVSWTTMICGCVTVGDMVEAQAIFDLMPVQDLTVWNVMISGFVDTGNITAALRFFEAMPSSDIGSWNLIISGLCKAGQLECAWDFFNKMPKRNVASWTMMVDGYVRIGDVINARYLFDQMPEKNLVSWSTMIAGYARNGQPRLALDLFEQYEEQGCELDETFILVVILACSQLGALDKAEAFVHKYMRPSHFSNVQLITSLIDMYAKCGSVEKALKVFEKANRKDLLCYSTMIAAFANHGIGQDAISLFDEMQRENIKPDGVTFLGVLSACNHGGLVEEGRKFFRLMTEDFCIQPSERHYACMVDLLGRAGCLYEAYNLIRSMPMEPHSGVWGALLAACRIHNNVELAEIAAEQLFKIEPGNSGSYVLLSNIYAAAERWEDVARVRAMLREHGVRKNRGSSWIELGSVVHEFVMGDVSHLDSDRIYLILDLLVEDMKLSGYLIDSKQKVLPSPTAPLPSLIPFYDIMEDG
ncbi:pentatricopeptide repeat-containing protein At4g02750-like [Telopea speciosissima]|uniref:pentatricopeptide repeat-containing protein At4g02750-like n=1 Tax=Telopea speciosissima TaxID=54955 RepID=UPI001CC538B6|nr:pentatricopeptide repeat-containing protein At4g02750-like [Telopea speciosissima]